MRVALLLSLIFVCKSSSAGQAAQAPVTVIVTGTVTDSVNSEPLRRALVSLIGPERYFAFTDASSEFQIEKVATGRYGFPIAIRLSSSRT